jgi:1-phosphofructokinase family hexose kinase
MPGGKGVNVARVLKTLGQPVIATGLAGGPTGTRIVEQLTHLSVLSDFVRIREESRTNTAVIDPTTGEQTRSTSAGPSVSEQEVELFVDKLLYLAKGAKWCVFAGSLPRNVDVDIYARLIRELRRLDVVCVVDTDGDPLRRAVRAEPDMITPNVLEAEELVGHEFNDAEDHVIAVREMLELGAREAVMTMPDGCYAMLPLRGTARRAHALPRARAAGADRAARHRRLGATRSSPASSPRATAASPPSRRSSTASPAARSPRSTSAQVWWIQGRSTACSATWWSSAPRSPPSRASDRGGPRRPARFPRKARGRRAVPITPAASIAKVLRVCGKPQLHVVPETPCPRGLFVRHDT